MGGKGVKTSPQPYDFLHLHQLHVREEQSGVGTAQVGLAGPRGDPALHPQSSEQGHSLS